MKARLTFFLNNGGIGDVITRFQNGRACHVAGHFCLDNRMLEVHHPRAECVTMDYYPHDRPFLTMARECSMAQAERIDARLAALKGRPYDGSRLAVIEASMLTGHRVADGILDKDTDEIICCDSALPALEELGGRGTVPYQRLATVDDLLWITLLDPHWWKDASRGLETLQLKMATRITGGSNQEEVA